MTSSNKSLKNGSSVKKGVVLRKSIAFVGGKNAANAKTEAAKVNLKTAVAKADAVRASLKTGSIAQSACNQKAKAILHQKVKNNRNCSVKKKGQQS